MHAYIHTYIYTYIHTYILYTHAYRAQQRLVFRAHNKCRDGRRARAQRLGAAERRPLLDAADEVTFGWVAPRQDGAVDSTSEKHLGGGTGMRVRVKLRSPN